MKEILSRVQEEFPNERESIFNLWNMNEEISEQITNALRQVDCLKTKVITELENNGITTGLDSRFQTLIKNLKSELIEVFSKIFTKKDPVKGAKKALPNPSFEDKREVFRDGLGKADTTDKEKIPIETHNFVIEEIGEIDKD